MTPLERKAIYLKYLEMKIAEEDWHGVADCAMDLREIEVELRLEPKPVPAPSPLTQKVLAHRDLA